LFWCLSAEQIEKGKSLKCHLQRRQGNLSAGDHKEAEQREPEANMLLRHQQPLDVCVVCVSHPNHGTLGHLGTVEPFCNHSFCNDWNRYVSAGTWACVQRAAPTAVKVYRKKAGRITVFFWAVTAQAAQTHTVHPLKGHTGQRHHV